MRLASAYRTAVVHLRRGRRADDFHSTHTYAALSAGPSDLFRLIDSSAVPALSQDRAHSTTGVGALGAWLLVLAAATPAASNAEAPSTKGGPGSAAPTFAASAASSAAGSGSAAAAAAGDPRQQGDSPPGLTNHPLEYDPVTNEHTAKMTLARTAALEYYNAGKYAQAEARFREAVAEAQLGFEPGDAHIASAKNNLAEFLRNVGRWDEAEQLYKEALDLLERNFGEKHWLFVSALHNLALSYEARGDLPAARAAMERVLALRLSMFGPRHFLYADSLFALGHMLRAVPGQGEAALRMMKEAVRVLEEAEKVQVNVALYWLTELASCHTADGHPDQAASVLRRAVAHMAADRGEDAAAASALNEQLVDSLAAAGKPAAASEAAAAALAARRKMFGEGALVVAQTELRLAQLLLLSQGRDAQPHGSPAASSSQLQQQQQQQPDHMGAPEPHSTAARALQHVEAAARISASTVEECSKGGLMSGPPADRVMKRLRAAHTLGSAAKLTATLSGVGDAAAGQAPPVDDAAGSTSATAEPPTASAAGPSTSPAAAASSGWFAWWPFGGRGKDKDQAPEPAVHGAEREQKPAAPPQAVSQIPRPPAVPVVELAAADRRLDQSAVALVAAIAAGQELMRGVGSGRRQLPKGVTMDELAGLLVEAQLQLLDVLDRLGLVLQARVAAGQGAQAGTAAAAGRRGGEDVVARHQRVLEQQQRVAEELLG